MTTKGKKTIPTRRFTKYALYTKSGQRWLKRTNARFEAQMKRDVKRRM